MAFEYKVGRALGLLTKRLEGIGSYLKWLRYDVSCCLIRSLTGYFLIEAWSVLKECLYLTFCGEWYIFILLILSISIKIIMSN